MTKFIFLFLSYWVSQISQNSRMYQLMLIYIKFSSTMKWDYTNNGIDFWVNWFLYMTKMYMYNYNELKISSRLYDVLTTVYRIWNLHHIFITYSIYIHIVYI